MNEISVYFPKDMTSFIEKVHKGGKIKEQGIIIFLDISGFSALTDYFDKKGSQGIEQLVEILNDYFGDIIASMREGGGVLLKFSGDGLLFYFPMDYRDDVLSLLKSVILKWHRKKLNIDGKEFILSVSAGVSAGEFYEILVEGKERKERVIIGEVPSQAMIAEAIARPGEIVVVESFYNKGPKNPIGRRIGRYRAIEPSEFPNISEISRKIPSFTSTVDFKDTEQMLKFLPHSKIMDFSDEHRYMATLFINWWNLPIDADFYSAVFSKVDEIVERFGGFINKVEPYFKGSRIMAVFGLPALKEEPGIPALYAGLEIKKFLEEKKVAFKISVTSGRSFAGTIGSKNRKEFTIIGNSVNKAERLLRIAKVEEVLVGDEVKKKSGVLFLFKKKHSLLLEKTNFLKDAWILTKEKKSKPFYFTPFVGREKEVLEVMQILSKSIEGNRSLVHIIAQAGMGKTRFIHEIKKKAEKLGIKTYMLKGSVFYQDVPYFPFRAFFKDFFTLPYSFDEVRYRREMDRIFKRLGKEEWERELFMQVLGWKGDKSPTISNIKDKFSLLVLDILKQRLKETPTIFAIDDAQWLDNATVELINYLYSGLKGFPILFIISQRPEERIERSFATLQHRFQLRLREISPESADKIIKSIAGDVSVPEEVIRIGAGNPFFLEELTKHVLKTEKKEEFPSTIYSLILARIDLLGAEEKDTLKRLSVVGQEFDFKIAEYLNPEIKENLRFVLNSLKNYGLIYEPERLKYLFKHELIRNTAYNLLPFRERRRFHNLIAEWYEKRLNYNKEFIEAVAFHYSRAENWEKALPYLIEAGDRAYHNYSFEEAFKFYENALVNMNKVYTDKKSLYKESFLLIEKILKSLIKLRKRDKILYYLKVMEGLTLVLNEIEYRFKLRYYTAEYEMYVLENNKKAAEIFQNLKNDVTLHKDKLPVLYKLVKYEYGNVLYRIGNIREAIKETAEAIESSPSISEDYRNMLNLSLYLITEGELEKAAEWIEKAEKSGKVDIYQKAHILAQKATYFYHKGDFGRAYHYFKEAAEMAYKSGDMHTWLRVKGNEGTMLILLKRYKEAIKVMEQVLDYAVKFNYRRSAAYRYANLASLYGRLGDLEKALKYYWEAYRIRVKLNEKPGIASVLSNIGFLYLNTGELEKAERFLKGSLVIFEKIGDKSWVMENLKHLSWVMLLKKEYDKARKLINRCIKVAQETGYTRYFPILLSYLALSYIEEAPLKAFYLSCKSLREERKEKAGELILLYVHIRILLFHKKILHAKKYIKKSLEFLKEEIKSIPQEYRRKFYNNLFIIREIIRLSKELKSVV